jgi:hypothetical protein
MIPHVKFDGKETLAVTAICITYGVFKGLTLAGSAETMINRAIDAINNVTAGAGNGVKP